MSGVNAHHERSLKPLTLSLSKGERGVFQQPGGFPLTAKMDRIGPKSGKMLKMSS